MQVVGRTTQQEAWAVSRERKFRINEILVVEDPNQGPLKGEVVETQSYNRFLPLTVGGGLVDEGVVEALEHIGYNVDDEELNIARVRLFEEAQYPIATGARVRLPEFSEVERLLVKASPSEGIVLGVIKSTEEIACGMPCDLQDVAPLLGEDGVLPQSGVPFNFPIRDMQQYPHIGIFGGSGSGKSFGMRVLLEELMKLRVPAVVLDPHFEMDFSSPLPGLPEKYGSDFAGCFDRLRVGRDVGVNFEKLSTQDLTNLLAASGGPFSEAMVNAVGTLHKRMDSYIVFKERLEGLRDALMLGKVLIERKFDKGEISPEEKERYLDYIEKYGSLYPQTVQAILWRLERLYREGVFTHNIDPVERGISAGKLAIIQGETWLLNVFAAYLLSNLYRRRRNYKDAQQKGERAEKFPPFVVATDEAHQFAPKAYDSPAKSVIKEIAQEGRKYGVFLILASQRPASLEETVTAQLNTKLVFRTVRASDIDTIREETDLSAEEARRLPYLRSGDGFLSSAITGRTIPLRIRASKTSSPHIENPFDELWKEVKSSEDAFLEAVQELLPLNDVNLVAVLPDMNKRLGDAGKLEVRDLKAKLDMLAEKGLLEKRPSPFGGIYDVINRKV